MSDLSLKEVEQFTGTDVLKRQKAWLKKNNIPYMLKDNGDIVTTWEVINQVLSSNIEATNEPDFGAMDKY